jgi:hypothetical protein
MSGACGGSSTPGGDDMPPNDGSPAPETITVTGTAVEISSGDPAPLEGVLVEAFANSDENTVVTSAMTDASGNYTLTITTNGVALDGYLKATSSGLIDTYLYPPEPLAEDFDGASINMISSGTLGLLTNAFLCNEDQQDTNGLIAMLAYDATDMPVAGVTFSSNPAATSDCYNGAGGGLPNDSNMETAEDGIGYLFNVTGQATVSATADGLTFPSHEVKARAGTLTTTLIRP